MAEFFCKTENIKRLQKMLLIVLFSTIVFVCLQNKVLASINEMKAHNMDDIPNIMEPKIVSLSDNGTKAIYTMTKNTIKHFVQEAIENGTDVITVKLDNIDDASFVSLKLEAEAVQYAMGENEKTAFLFESPWLSYYVSTTDFDIKDLTDMMETSVDSLTLLVEFGRITNKEREQIEQRIAENGGELIYSPVSFNVLAEVHRPEKENSKQTETFIMRNLPGKLLFPADKMASLNWGMTTIVRVDSSEIGSENLKRSQLLPVFITGYDRGEYVVPQAIGDYSYMAIQISRTFEDIVDLAEQSAIEFMASKFIFSGRDQQCFAPNDHLTQAELAALVVRMLGMEGKYYPLEKIRHLAAVAFDDVKEEDWFSIYAGSLYYAGRIPVGWFGAYSLATLEQLNDLLFSPGTEVVWNVPEGEGTLLTRAKAAEIMYEYYLNQGQ